MLAGCGSPSFWPCGYSLSWGGAGGSPLKKVRFPAHEVAMMMTIALRFIPTLGEEAEKIRGAQAARGADFPEGGPLRRARSFIPVLVPLTVGAFRRADELAAALERRGYRG